MPAITPIRAMSVPETIQVPAGASRSGDFRSLVEGAIGRVEQTRQDAARNVESYLAGEGGELHTTILAAQRAELALDLFLQTRNKVAQAYKEIMQMQI
jgi:flagellar hook-basal body complex protein FliE